MIEKDLRMTGKCRVYIAKEPWDNAKLAFAFPKNSKLAPIFSKQ